MKKTKLIQQTGLTIRGTAVLELWGGGTGTAIMDAYFLPFDKVTPKNILRCVNDGQFGCQGINSAEIDIYIKYDNGSEEIERTWEVSHPIHTQFFLGWQSLRAQGIKV